MRTLASARLPISQMRLARVAHYVRSLGGAWRGDIQLRHLKQNDPPI